MLKSFVWRHRWKRTQNNGTFSWLVAQGKLQVTGCSYTTAQQEKEQRTLNCRINNMLAAWTASAIAISNNFIFYTTRIGSNYTSSLQKARELNRIFVSVQCREKEVYVAILLFDLFVCGQNFRLTTCTVTLHRLFVLKTLLRSGMFRTIKKNANLRWKPQLSRGKYSTFAMFRAGFCGF